jgi:hypothetical protein
MRNFLNGRSGVGSLIASGPLVSRLNIPLAPSWIEYPLFDKMNLLLFPTPRVKPYAVN